MLYSNLPVIGSKSPVYVCFVDVRVKWSSCTLTTDCCFCVLFSGIALSFQTTSGGAFTLKGQKCFCPGQNSQRIFSTHTVLFNIYCCWKQANTTKTLSASIPMLGWQREDQPNVPHHLTFYTFKSPLNFLCFFYMNKYMNLKMLFDENNQKSPA